MYINFNYLDSKGLNDYDLINFVIISQQDTFRIERHIDSMLVEQYEQQGWVQYTKGSGSWPERLRLTKKGKDIIQLATTYEYNDDIGRLATKLQSMYLDFGVEENRVGKTKKVIDLLVWYLSATDFSMTEIYLAIEKYLQETDPKFVANLENLFWRKQSVYSVHPTIKDSTLFEYMCQILGRDIVSYVEPTKKAKKFIEWVSRVVNTQIPANLPDQCYFTGSYKGDIQAKNRIKTTILQNLK